MNRKAHIAGYIVAFVVLAGVALAPVAQGVNVIQSPGGGTTTAFDRAKSENIERNDTIKAITDILLYVIGAAAVITIILGGIKYTTANGDASQIKSAKDTIMYAVIGLVVAIMAWGIVSFVVNQFG